MRPHPLICVADVETSSRWNRRLLGYCSDHGGPNHLEIWLRDPNGYTVVLANPDGTAGGTWKPDPPANR